MSKKPVELFSIEDVRVYVKKLIRMGRDVNAIKLAAKKRVSNNSSLTPDVVDDIVGDVVDSYPNYDLMQTIVNNRLIMDKDSKGDTLYVVDRHGEIITQIWKNRLADMFLKPDFSDKTYVAEFSYNPFKFNTLYRDGPIWKFNTYRPANWMKDYFISAGEKSIPVVKTLPEIYRKFLMHLVNDDLDSFNYILDWIANAIKSRNFCILTTIGNQGIGKGVLGEIFSKLVGETNFTLTDNKLVQKNFNAQLKDKRLVYLDEIHIKTSSEINKFKSLINSVVEIEKKGFDAVTVNNYASIYTSSNDMDAIKLPGDDRRFSIVNLTDKKLKDYFDEPIESLLIEDNIQELGNYLWHREVDKQKMLEIFRSSRTEEVREATLTNWQEYFLNVYVYKYIGKRIKLQSVSDDIKTALDDYSFNLGRSAFRKLQGRYPTAFRVYRPRVADGEPRYYFIDIPDAEGNFKD